MGKTPPKNIESEDAGAESGFDVRNRIKHLMNYGIFDQLCAPNPSLSIASIIMDYNNYNRINWCNSIWVFNLCAFLPEWSLNCTESESNIAAIVSRNTNGIWSANHAKLGVKLGIWYQRIGCKVLNHQASQIWLGWVGLVSFSQRSPTRIVRKVALLLVAGWQMMYNEKFCRYCQPSSATTRVDKYFFGCRWMRKESRDTN